MKHNIPVKKVMVPFPYSVDIEDSVADAKLLMTEHNIRHLPVTRSGKLVGILSERDVHLSRSVVTQFAAEHDLRVESIYVPSPFAVDIEIPVGRVATEMAMRHIGSAVVMKGEKIAGIFTSTDACRYLGEILGEAPNEEPPEAA